MQLEQAQQDMNHAYLNGASGVLVSGIIWSIAGVVALLLSPWNSMLTLFFGGMVIFPLSMVVAKLAKRPGSHQKDNPLGRTAMENTFILFVGLFIAFMVANLKIEWFYPIMLLTIGVRYLGFQTLYANRLYWVLGGVLMASGMALMLLNADFYLGAFIGGGIEVLFSLVLFKQAHQMPSD